MSYLAWKYLVCVCACTCVFWILFIEILMFHLYIIFMGIVNCTVVLYSTKVGIPMNCELFSKRVCNVSLIFLCTLSMTLH
jgi:hypothetical protein